MSELDALLEPEDVDEPVRRSRGRMAVATFATAVVTACIGLVLLGLLLYGLMAGAWVLWAAWWDDFG